MRVNLNVFELQLIRLKTNYEWTNYNLKQITNYFLTYGEFVFKILLIWTGLDCIFVFPIDLTPTRIPFGVQSIGKTVIAI